MSPKSDYLILTILRGRGRSTVNGWSDAVEDAEFEYYGSNNPLVPVSFLGLEVRIEGEAASCFLVLC